MIMIIILVSLPLGKARLEITWLKEGLWKTSSVGGVAKQDSPLRAVKGYVSANHELWAHQVSRGLHRAPELH